MINAEQLELFPKVIKIEAYEFNQLDDDAKIKVIHWLDEWPLENVNQDDEGNIEEAIEYFSDMEEEYIQEHCEINNYLFNKYGECVHHLAINYK